MEKKKGWKDEEVDGCGDDCFGGGGGVMLMLILATKNISVKSEGEWIMIMMRGIFAIWVNIQIT